MNKYAFSLLCLALLAACGHAGNPYRRASRMGGAGAIQFTETSANKIGKFVSPL